MIVEAIPGKLKRSQQGIIQDAQARAKAVLIQKDFVEYCTGTARAFAAGEAELSVRTKLPPEPLKEILTELIREGKVINLTAKLYVHSDTAADVQQRLLDIVGEFHTKRPESPGMSLEELYRASGLEKDVFDGLIKLLISGGRLAERKHRLALPAHCETFSEVEQELLKTVESFFSSRPFNPPKLEEVVEHTAVSADNVERILRILVEQENLVKVESNLLFHREAVEQARQILTSFVRKEGRLESVKFKYLLDSTRKFAIPLLDYFDRIGVTRRVGNTRYLKTPAGSS
jgi:selenocysteine-specific elongation factor